TALTSPRNSSKVPRSTRARIGTGKIVSVAARSTIIMARGGTTTDPRERAGAYSTDVCHPVQRKVGSWPLLVNIEGVGRFQLTGEPTLTRFPRFPLHFMSTLIGLALL